MKLIRIIITVVILVILSTTSFFIGIKYNTKQQLNQDRKYYLNHIYEEMDNTVQLLKSVDNWGKSINTTDITANPYGQLLLRINSMKAISKQALVYMRNDESRSFLHRLTESFNLIGNSIGSGVSFNNQLVCDDFLKDGALSKAEISFLTSFKEDLENMKSGLYSEETKQENPNISMKGIAEIIRPFTDKYSISNLNSIGLKN